MKYTNKIPSLFLTALLLVSTLAGMLVPAGPAAVQMETGDAIELANFSAGYIVPNEGQVKDPSVLFHTANAYFTASSVIFRVPGATVPEDARSGPGEPMTGNYSVYTLGFEGANDVLPGGTGDTGALINFISGNNPSGHLTGIEAHTGIIYEKLYDGIDLVFRPVSQGLKYEFVISPGGDARDIRMAFEGATAETDGQTITIRTASGTVRDTGLCAFYRDGGEIPVTIDVADNTATFDIKYDRTRTIIIDPLIYSTFLGGTGMDHARSISVDSAGSAYVCGYTDSNDFPTTNGAYNSSNSGGQSDAFVLKLDANGTSLVWATYIGGAKEDRGYVIHADNSSCVYVTGYTNSSDFPTTVGAFDTTYNGVVSYDPFLLKLNADGNALNYSTYLGGSYVDYTYGLDIDGAGNAYVTGYTYATDYPTTAGAYDATHGGGWYDAFVTKVNSAGTALVYSTYLGGNGDDYGYGLRVDSSNNAYITGNTYSTDFPATAGAYATANLGGGDAFVTKLNAAGNALSYSTYLGNTGTDTGYDLALDMGSNAYVVGYTTSTNFPTTAGAYDTTYNTNTDGFVTKLNAAGSALGYSTFIGGSGADYPRWITVDSANRSYICGVTDSNNYPTTPGADDTSWGGGFYDIIVSVFNATGNNVTFSSYLGGNGDDYGRCIALDVSDNFYITGQTSTSTYPTTNGAYQTTYGGAGDAYATKMRVPAKPGPPINVTPVSGNGYITLGWSPPNDTGGLRILNYTIYRGLNPSPLAALATVGNIAGYNDTSVSNGVKYYYALSAWNLLGEGVFSATVNATAGSPPGAPLAFTTIAGNGFVRLDWSPPVSNGGFAIQSYNYYRGPDPLSLASSGSTGLLNANDTSIQNGVTYYYAVAAVNLVGEGPRTLAQKAVPGAPPSVPRDFTGELWDLHVMARWSAPVSDGGFPVTGYRLYRGSTENTLGLLNQTTALIYHDASAMQGASYYYAVSASNDKGEGARSPAIRVDVGTVPAKLSLIATPGDGTVGLTWTPGSDGGFPVTGYRLYRGQRTDQLQFLANSTGLAMTDSAVTNGVTYYYAIAAINLKGAGPQSDPVSARPQGEGKLPSAPQNLAAEPGDAKVLVSWVPPADSGGQDITGYRLYRGLSSSDLALLSPVTILNYEDSAVVIGQTYYYAVSAVNSRGEGPGTSPVSASASGTGRLPGAPANLTAGAGDATVSLDWESPKDTGGLQIGAYIVYRGTDASALSKITEVAVRSHNDTAVTNGQTYYYAVSAVNFRGEGPRGAPVLATPAYTGGIPGAPTGLNGTAGDLFVVIRWKVPASDGGSPVTGYKVFRGSQASPPLLAATILLTYLDEDVQNGQSYTYRVAAVNARGTGPVSDPVTLSPGGLPSAPRELHLTRTGSSNALSWQLPGSNGGFLILSYNIYRGTSSDNVVYIGNTASPTFPDRVRNDVAYYYKVAALTAKGEGPGAWTVSSPPAKNDKITTDNTMSFYFPVIAILLIVLIVVAAAAYVRASGKPPQAGSGPDGVMEELRTPQSQSAQYQNQKPRALNKGPRSQPAQSPPSAQAYRRKTMGPLKDAGPTAPATKEEVWKEDSAGSGPEETPVGETVGSKPDDPARDKTADGSTGNDTGNGTGTGKKPGAESPDMGIDEILQRLNAGK